MTAAALTETTTWILRGGRRLNATIEQVYRLATRCHPDLLMWQEAHVAVETTSELARGLVVADRGLSLQLPGPTNATVAVATHVDAFRQMFLTRIGTEDK